MQISTARPFDYSERKLALSAEGAHNSISGEVDPKLSFLASDTWGDWGALVSFSRADRTNRTDSNSGVNFRPMSRFLGVSGIRGEQAQEVLARDAGVIVADRTNSDETNLIIFQDKGGDRVYLSKVGHIVGSYLRGQLTISAISGFNVSLFLTLFGAPFPLLIGLFAGVLNMIPNVGIIITNVLGVVIALIFGTPVDALVVVLVLFGQQIAEFAVNLPDRACGVEIVGGVDGCGHALLCRTSQPDTQKEHIACQRNKQQSGYGHQYFMDGGHSSSPPSLP